MVKTPSLGVRLPAELKAALERAAKDDLRSMSSMVEKILTLHLKANGYLDASKPKPRKGK